MTTLRDLTGKTFGGWRVIKRDLDNPDRRHTYWLAECIGCGAIASRQAGNLRRSALYAYSGCAECVRKAVDWEKVNAHTVTHGRYQTPEYRTWLGMKARCSDLGDPYYGGRGIKVCDEWRHDFLAFYEHVGPRPSDEHSIDRIDVDGDYEPGNVRWAKQSEQNANKRPCLVCVHGHSLADGDPNTRIDHRRDGRTTKACRQCDRDRRAAYREAARAERAA